MPTNIIDLISRAVGRFSLKLKEDI